ncbi:hypothetical protein QBC38DRAFT_491523 [Podospora fimiseda]|uniref:Uncharacterized protein n=1 Tax=Podospora fimiseda TaxID=252190 RepID=A0AAN7BF44_9PEZI|nr:hypothetical protein QBC38DRAFT_491523 [Podospora fimiseda]
MMSPKTDAHLQTGRGKQPEQSNILIILAILISVLIATIDTLVTIKSFYLRSVGTLTETQRQLYIQGTTVLATILTKFIVSQAQTLFLRHFDHRLHASAQQHSETSLTQLSKKWRSILQVSSIQETWSSWSRLAIFATYFLIGLITAAMVTSLSPTISSRTTHYPQAIFNGRSLLTENTGNCDYILPVENATRVNDQEYWWDLNNGSALWMPANIGACPTRYAQLLIGNINGLDAESFAYADNGVAVHRSAIGAPITIYSPHPGFAPGLNSTLAKYRSHALTTKQCVPVMRRNPIFCRTGGTVTLTNNTFKIVSDDGLCTFTRRFSSRNPREKQTMVKHMCPHSEVGQGTIVIAASGGYAHWLAVGINDVVNAPPTNIPVYKAIYSISCTVDARDVYEHKMVQLDLRASDGRDGGARYTRFLSSGERCQGPEMSMSRLATVAAANWQTLFQNDGTDGWFDLVWEATGGHYGRKEGFGFGDSTNALEDVLGLVTAMVGARFNGSERYVIDTVVEIEATRVGSGSLLVLLWVLAPLFAAGVIVTLLVMTEKLGFRSIELNDLKNMFWESEGRGYQAWDARRNRY